MADYNPWHGCHKISNGCLNCYMFRRDSNHGIDSNIVKKTKSFNMPIRKNKDGTYKYQNEVMWTCFTSDFFIDEADEWRGEVWEMMKERADLNFFMITKRPHRIKECLPSDWGDGYTNVTIFITCENQEMADKRIPIYLELPIKYKGVCCEPFITEIDIEKYLDGRINEVIAGGESGNEARQLDYNWVLKLREQCIKTGTIFVFRQTGARLFKDGKLYRILRKHQIPQARKANINVGKTRFNG